MAFGRRKSEWNIVAVLLIIALLIFIPMGFYIGWQTIFKPKAGVEIPGVSTPVSGPGEIFYGPIEIRMDCQNVYDLSNPTANEPTVKIWDSSRSSSLPITLDGSTPTIFNLKKEDKGKAWLTVDFGTSTTYFVDPVKTKEFARGYITGWEPWDYDKDGTLEWAFALDFSQLTPLTGGETAKKVQFNIAVISAASSVTFTSVLNPTGVSTTAYMDYYATGYINVPLGQGFKVVRMRLNVPTSGDNKTYVENGYVKLMDITMGWPDGTKVYSGADLSWDSGASRYDINMGIPDINNEYYGKLVYRDRNVGATSITYSVHILAKFPATDKAWCPTLELTLISPAGTISTISVQLSYTS
ncbi:MAG: hypothetical protein QXT31_08305 [Candidatus Bathyarchaeia archaeon]